MRQASPPPDRLTLAFYTLDYPPGRFVSSIGLYTQKLAAALAERGHRVFVVSRSEGGESVERDGQVTVLRLGPPRVQVPARVTLLSASSRVLTGFYDEVRFRRRLAAKLSELVVREGVDLIEAADSAAEAGFYTPQRHPRVPLVVRLHGPTAITELFDRNVPELGRRLIRRAERALFVKATHLTTPSEASRELFRRELALGERPIAVFPNIPTLDPSAVAVSEGGVADPDVDPNLVLYVGRSTRQKGLQFLIQAIPGVLEAYPAARFVFVGPDGPSTGGHSSFQAYLVSQVPERYRSALHFTGFKPHDEVRCFYKRAACCVFPSVFESFGYTCLEAMTYGKAIVASPTGGMAEMLDEGRCGLLYRPPDADELRQHILTLLSDAALRQRLGQAARQRALTRYHPEVIVTKTERFYYRAVAECTRR
jgi:glycogen(starch) synthase